MAGPSVRRASGRTLTEEKLVVAPRPCALLETGTAVSRSQETPAPPQKAKQGSDPTRPQDGFRGLTRVEGRAGQLSRRGHPCSRSRPRVWRGDAGAGEGRSRLLGGCASRWHFRRRSPPARTGRAPDEGPG